MCWSRFGGRPHRAWCCRSTAILPLFHLLSTYATAQFAPPQPVAADVDMGQHSRIEAVDIDGDGDNDFVFISGTALVLARNIDGNGTFAPLDTLHDGATLFAVADVDMDGDPDVVLFTLANQLAWRANVDGLGATGPLQVVHELGTAAGALVCTQLAGGPAPDIALAYHDGGTANVRLFQNNLSGFGSPQTRGYGAPGAGLALLAGDMDQNGHTDLVAMDGAGNLTVLANDGGDPGSWGIHAVGSTQPEARLQLIDVDGDGDLDLLTTQWDLLEWFENVSTIANVLPFVGHADTEEPMDHWGHAAHLGCGEELAVLHYQGISGLVHWHFYDPDVHELVPPGIKAISGLSFNHHLLATADINGDGRMDLLHVGSYWDGEQVHVLQWYANELPTEVEPLESAPLGPVCATGDPVDLNDMASLPAGLWWNGPDGLGTMFDPASTGLGVHTLTCHVTDPCPRSAQTTIEVVAPVLEEASGTPYDIAAPCAMDPLVFAATPPGGTWSGMADPNGVVVRSCASRPNWGAVAYTVDLPGLGSCTGYSEVMILPACIPISLGPDTVLCTNSDLLAVPVQPFGEVTLSGFDTVTWEHVPPASPTPTGWFDPDKAPGTYMLTAMVTGTGNCPGHDTMYIHVAEHEFIDITTTPVDTLCRFGDPYPLSGHATPTGGNWSGPGVQDGVFTPPGEGSFTVYYGFAESCAYAPVTIEVIEEPTVVAVSGNPDALCEFEPLVYAATPADGTWWGSVPVSPDGVIDRSCEARPQWGPVFYTYTAPNGECTGSDDTYFNLLPCLYMNLGPDTTVCSSADTLMVTALGPYNGGVGLGGFDLVVHHHPGVTGWFDPDKDPGIYTLTVEAGGQGVCPGHDTLLVTVVDCDGVALAARAFLEGPYTEADGLMRDDLRAQGLLPVAEPYTAMGFDHVGGGGEQTTAAVLAATGPDAIVDWVMLELRPADDPTTVSATRSALLQRDGDIVDGADGTSPVRFAAPDGNYHVVVRHRNHLAAMSAVAVPLATEVPQTVDLALPATATWGTDARKATGGAMLLWAGDVNGDGTLRYTGSDNDRDPMLSAIGGAVPTAMAQGYGPADVNMDGFVRYTGADNDREPVLVNVGGLVPTAERTVQLP